MPHISKAMVAKRSRVEVDLFKAQERCELLEKENASLKRLYAAQSKQLDYAESFARYVSRLREMLDYHANSAAYLAVQHADALMLQLDLESWEIVKNSA